MTALDQAARFAAEVRAAHQNVVRVTRLRDEQIRLASTDGESLRVIGKAVELTHEQIRNIVTRDQSVGNQDNQT